MLIAAPQVDGFDPSAPMQFHTSDYTVALPLILGIGGLACIIVVATSHGLLAEGRGGLFVGRLALALGVIALAILAFTIPASPVAPQRFDACEQAAQWAHGRYDVKLTHLDCENLFLDTKDGFLSGSRGGETLLDDGRIIESKEIGGKTLLVDQGGEELPVRTVP